MAYRAEPRDRTGRIARLQQRLSRQLGSRVRLVWNPSAGSNPTGRWSIQEKGKTTGAWQHVWLVQGPGNTYREPGDWVMARLNAMDLSLAGCGTRGLAKLTAMAEGPRKARIKNRLQDTFERYRDLIMPKVMRFMREKGISEAPGKRTAEQLVQSVERHLVGRGREYRTETLELVREMATDVPVKGGGIIIPGSQMPGGEA